MEIEMTGEIQTWFSGKTDHLENVEGQQSECSMLASRFLM